jgi:hypothetical protein
MAEEIKNISTPPAEVPKPPKKKGALAYTSLALIAYALDALLLSFLNGFGGSFFNNLGGIFGLGFFVIALITFVLSFVFFRNESLRDRILKSILGTLLAALVAILVGFGLCFLILSAYR